MYELIVETSGAYSCSGTFGTVIVYNRVGTEVERRDLQMSNSR
ncbi:MAG: hypothetical protein ACREMJ_08050 [Gemmatimonadales bacterium]